MYVCWKCGQELDNDPLFCSNCNAINPGQTPTIDVDRIKKTDVDQALEAKIRGVNSLHNRHLLEVVIGDERITIPIESRVIFGRDLTSIDNSPVIDLARFNALDVGVSRRHATLQRSHDDQVMLIDLGSTNGTFLNKTKLKPLQEYPVKNGDEIRFGNLALILRFSD